MKRLLPAAFGFTYAVVPFFPAFITLTAVSVPGVSLVPRGLALGLLGGMALVAVYAIVMLLAPPRERPPTLVPLIAWLGAALLSALAGFDARGGLLFVGIFGLSIVWHLTLMRYYDAPGVSRAICWSYMLSGALASFLAIAMVLARAPASQYTIGHGRAIGTFILPAELAGYLIIYLPIAWAITRVSHDVWLRRVAWVGIAFGAIAFVMTFSRAGWMGLAAAIAFYVFVMHGMRRPYMSAAILGAGLVAVLIVFNAHHNPSENYTRLSIWQAGLEIVRRFPLTGVGPFNFARIYPLVRLPDGDATAFHAHSFLLTIFAETGLIGVLAVLYAWWRFAVELRARVRGVSRAHALIAFGVVAGLVGTWVQGLIDTVSVVIFGLWLPAMALALVTARYGLGEEEG